MTHHKNVSEEVFRLNFFALTQKERDQFTEAFNHRADAATFSDLVWYWNNTNTTYDPRFHFLPTWFCDPSNTFDEKGKLIRMVERYAVLIQTKNGLVLFSDNIAENHFNTELECEAYIEGIQALFNLTIDRIFGKGAALTMQCRKIPCYANGVAMHTIYPPKYC